MPLDRVPRLAELAESIRTKVPDLVVSLDSSWSSTDRKIPGTRMIHPGKGRKGSKLLVRDPNGETVLEHDSSETYRTNSEAADKVRRLFGEIWVPSVTPSYPKIKKELREFLLRKGYKASHLFSFHKDIGEGYSIVELCNDRFKLTASVDGKRIERYLRYIKRNFEVLP